uniref:Uncharacterized protein n=1 Tax=Leersia perrieri TaxID=77586 RepID=A0A0D9XB01_9ORYZ
MGGREEGGWRSSAAASTSIIPIPIPTVSDSISPADDSSHSFTPPGEFILPALSLLPIANQSPSSLDWISQISSSIACFAFAPASAISINKVGEVVLCGRRIFFSFFEIHIPLYQVKWTGGPFACQAHKRIHYRISCVTHCMRVDKSGSKKC